MKKRLIYIGLALVLISIAQVVTAAPTSTIVQNLQITGLGSTGNPCLIISDTGGHVSTSTCGVGGSGITNVSPGSIYILVSTSTSNATITPASVLSVASNTSISFSAATGTSITATFLNPQGFITTGTLSAVAPVVYTVATGQFSFLNPGYITVASASIFSATQTFNQTTTFAALIQLSSSTCTTVNSFYNSNASGTVTCTAIVFPSQVATTTINGTQAASFFIVGTGAITSTVSGATTTFSLVYGENVNSPLTISTSTTFATTSLTTNASSGIQLSTISGILSIMNIGVTSATGTANQIQFNVSTGSITASFPTNLQMTNASHTNMQASGTTVLQGTLTQSGGVVSLASTTVGGNTTSTTATFTSSTLHGGPANFSSTVQLNGTTTVSSTLIINGNVNASGTVNASTSITIKGVAVSTSTVNFVTGTNGATTTQSGATVTVSVAPGTYMGIGTGGVLTVSSTLASSSVTFQIRNATTTAPLNLYGLQSTMARTITQLNCFEYAVATTTIALYYTTTTATSSVLSGSMIASSTVCGVAGTSTTNFTTSSLPAGAFLWASVSSTAGTPTYTLFTVQATKL